MLRSVAFSSVKMVKKLRHFFHTSGKILQKWLHVVRVNMSRLKQRQHFIEGVFVRIFTSWNDFTPDDSTELQGRANWYSSSFSRSWNYWDEWSRWNQHRNISLNSRFQGDKWFYWSSTFLISYSIRYFQWHKG